MGAPVHSQFAYFMRFAEYMPFLSKAYDHCKFLGLDFKEHITDFFKDKNGKKVQETSEAESITGVPINAKTAINVIENMEFVGGEPKDWDIDYSIQLGFYGGGKSISEANAYRKRRELYLELYNDYINR